MKKITLFLLFAFIFCGVNYAQCDFDGNQYPFDDQTAINDGVAYNISTCNYFGEYSVLNNLNIGEEYEFSGDGGFVTIIDYADGSTVLTSGASPLVWTSTVTEVEVHWAADAGCGTDSDCHTTTYQCTTCTPPPAPDCASTPFPADGAVDVPNGIVTFTWEAPTTGPTPTAYNFYAGETPSGDDYGLITTVTDLEADINLTGYDTLLYWKIVPVNESTEATGCPVWSFTTESAPPNFECTGAIAVACDGNYTGTTTGATDSGGNPAPDVWFSYTGSGVAEDVTIDLCGSGYDTLVRVFSDCPATNQIALNDDNAAACGTGSVRSYLTFSSDGTSTYYIMIEGYNTANGAFDMTITCSANIPAPANDLCANAEGLTLDVQASGTTAGATDSSTGVDDDTVCQPFQFKSDVWYSFVAPADGDVGIMTTITGSSDQANVAVYPDCNQLDDDSLGCSNGNGGEMLNVTGLTSGATYYVMVWSDGIAARGDNFRTEGTFNITVMDATLSTEAFQANSQELFTYFPNPVSDNLTIKAQKNIQNVSVYNMLGQTVINNVPNAIESNVDMSALKSGAYFVKVTVDNQTETIRIIRN